jgi:sacsin
MSAQWESFHQAEALTTRLRNILDEYPTGSGPFKEFLQNADDAGARTFALCLDSTRHPEEGLLAEGLAEWQGPALLVYNDASFREADFASISRLGQSGKFADRGKIGKYGLGFNVAYHFTDIPAFASAGSLVLFDPHARHLPGSVPGLRCPVAAPEQAAALTGQLAPFRAAAAAMAGGAKVKFTGLTENSQVDPKI